MTVLILSINLNLQSGGFVPPSFVVFEHDEEVELAVVVEVPWDHVLSFRVELERLGCFPIREGGCR